MARPLPVVRRLPSLLGASGYLARLMTDRLLPALLFGAAAAARCSSLLTRAGQGPAEPSSEAWLVYMLDLANHALAVLFCGLIATLFLIRRAPRGSRARPLAMTVAIAGTFGLTLLVAQPITTQDWRVLALADILLAVGLAFSIYAAASLRYCFGLAPEARGLVTSGAYRLVRHPLYVGEFVASLGTLLPVLAPATIVVYALFCLFQATRAVLEERVLATTFAEYAAYRRRTPALLPWPRP